MPNGSLGQRRPALIHIGAELSKEVTEVVRAYLAGKVGTMELIAKLEAITRAPGRQGPTVLWE